MKSGLPFIAVTADDLGEPIDAVQCARCGATHPIEHGTSQRLLHDNTWSTPEPSKTLGFYKCGGALYLGTVDGKKLK